VKKKIKKISDAETNKLIEVLCKLQACNKKKKQKKLLSKITAAQLRLKVFLFRLLLSACIANSKKTNTVIKQLYLLELNNKKLVVYLSKKQK